jgi:hypothetical protein
MASVTLGSTVVHKITFPAEYLNSPGKIGNEIKDIKKRG